MKRQDSELMKLELKISHFLRWGVLISGLVMLIGWGSHVSWAGNPFLRFQTYQEMSLKRQITQAWGNGEWGVICSYFGLFLLISLPVIRVLLTAILFFKQKERVLGLIALLVLFSLGVSFALGGVGG